ncbi:MAG: radical SAM protein [Chromatiales bacterium]|nr:radical SAM protein [Chromatiales bacterium]
MSGCAHDPSAGFAGLGRKAMAARVPLDGSIALTHRCNLRCIHCYLGDQSAIRRHRDQEMSTEEVTGVIDALVDAGTLNLTITGGDPMVRRDFPAIYAHAVRRGLLVTVFCDAVLVTERIVSLFRELPPRMVEVSLYGATAETYEAITQVPGSFARCLAGIERLAASRLRFKLKTVLMRANRHELDAMRAIARHYGVGFHFDTALFPCLPNGDNGGRANADRARDGRRATVDVAAPTTATRGLDGPLAQRLDPEEAARAHLSDPEYAAELAAFHARTRALPASDALYVCGAGLTSFHVDPYANLQPCTISTNLRYSLREGSFADGWNGPVAGLRELRAAPDHACTTCDKRGLCAGCPAVFAAETGAADRRSAYVCRSTHALHEALTGASAAADDPAGRAATASATGSVERMPEEALS